MRKTEYTPRPDVPFSSQRMPSTYGPGSVSVITVQRNHFKHPNIETLLFRLSLYKH